MSIISNLLSFFSSYCQKHFAVKRFSIFLFLSFAYCLLPIANCFSQSACPSVTVSPTNVSMCSGCTTLTATVQGSVATTSYAVAPTPYAPYSYNTGTNVLNNTDDWFTGVINLPFCFQFYGNTYTQCVIGSNAIISFDLIWANGPNTWPISAPIPDPTVPDLLNSIMGPWHDIDPGVSGNIYYNTYGTAPCRAFVVSWDQIAMFSCNNLIATSQIVLYETTNIIDIYIQDKPTCTTWNAGAAIEGIQNATGTQAVAVPGRNFPTNWTATNDGQRFTPTGAPQYSLAWFAPPNTQISTANTVTVCPTSTTTYTAVVTNTTCAAPVIVSAVASVVLGFGAPPTFSVTPAACTSNNGTATATPNGGSPPYTYLWSTAPPQNTQTATGLAPGNYSVTVTDATGCSGTATVTVTSSSGLTATSSSTQTSCTSNSGTATANPIGGTAPFTYVWSTAPAQNTQTATGLGTGTYTVIVTDVNGCSATITATVTAPNGLTSLTTTSTQVSCNGGINGSATANPAGGTAPYAYSWSTTPAQVTQTANALVAGTYTVIVTDVNGCSLTQIAVITQPTAMVISTTSTPTTCGINIGTATVTSSGGMAPHSYQWLTTPVQSTSTINGLAGGVYTVVVIDANGCNQTQNVSVGGGAIPAADFFFNPDVISTLDPYVVFTDGSAGNPTIWSWNFGDTVSGTSNSSSIQNPTHSYPVPGVYCITLMISDASGVCVDTVVKCLRAEAPFVFYMPNTFTPDSDFLNELFYAKGQGVKDYNIWIFDRWGNMIWDCHYKGEPTSWDGEGQEGMPSACKWDGKVTAGGIDLSGGSMELVQQDVYMWKVVLTDMHGQEHKYIGNVNVVK